MANRRNFLKGLASLAFAPVLLKLPVPKPKPTLETLPLAVKLVGAGYELPTEAFAGDLNIDLNNDELWCYTGKEWAKISAYPAPPKNKRLQPNFQPLGITPYGTPVFPQLP
jgi:hypothetical protein